MKFFNNINDLNFHLELNYQPLSTEEKKVIERLAEEGTLTIFENDEEAIEFIIEDLIANEMLEYITTEVLLDNLKEEFEKLYNATDTNDFIRELIEVSKEKLISATAFLSNIVNVDGVAKDILSYDGLGIYFNRYNDEELELIPLNNNQTYHTLTLT
jgi:hypothetical protein